MFTLKNEDKKTKILLVTFIGIYLFLCILSFIIHGDRGMLIGDLIKMDDDDVKYLRSAWTLLETGKYTYNYPDINTVFIMPGITTVLAGFVAVFGKYPILPFKIFQAILGALSLYITFHISRKVFSKNAALITVFISSIYFPNIFVANIILTEQIFTFLLTLLILIVYYAVWKRKTKYYIWGGVVLGLMALFRPTILMFPLVVLVLWIINKYKFVNIIKYSLLVIAIVCAMLSPWIIRNYMVFDKFIPLTLSSGNPFWKGTYINYDQSVSKIENIDYESLIRAEGKINYDDYGRNEIVNDEVETWIGNYRIKNTMTKEPLKYIYWYTIGKTKENWYTPFLWKNLFNLPSSLGYNSTTSIHRLYLIIAFAAIISLIRRKEFKNIHWLLILTVIYFNTVYLPFYCFSRYMYPVMFIVLIYTGQGVYELGRYIKSKLLRSK